MSRLSFYLLSALPLLACSGDSETLGNDVDNDSGSDLSSFDTDGDTDRRWDTLEDGEPAEDSSDDSGPDGTADADDTAPDSTTDAGEETGADAEPDITECRTGEECEDDDPCTVFRCIDRVCVSTIRDTDEDGSADGACGGTDCDDRSRDIRAGSERECSNSCGVTGIERCVDAMWTDCSAPLECDCSPGDEREEDCARCGTAPRSCEEDGTWGALGLCSGSGICEPDDVTLEDCDGLDCGDTTLYGVRALSCTESCVWSPGACLDAPVCCPGDVSERSCGSCGTAGRDCGGDGSWGEFGLCDEPECCVGDTDIGSCGDCGIRARSCEANTWSSWGGCVEPECCPGDMQSADCGDCGTQTLGCSDGSWVAVDVCIEPECCPGDSDSGECGECGTQTRDCVGESWGSWSLCLEPECCDGDTESSVCNDCGRISRTCVEESWGAWSTCVGSEGVARGCDPGFLCDVDGWCFCGSPPCEIP